MTPTVNGSIARIDAWRRASGLTIIELAKRSGLSKNTVSYVLGRTRTSCTLRTLAALESLVPADFVHSMSPSPVSGEAEHGRSCHEVMHSAPKICDAA
jgi:transcriptional regulator with XRE-family HTH domain